MAVVLVVVTAGGGGVFVGEQRKRYLGCYPPYTGSADSNWPDRPTPIPVTSQARCQFCSVSRLGRNKQIL